MTADTHDQTHWDGCWQTHPDCRQEALIRLPWTIQLADRRTADRVLHTLLTHLMYADDEQDRIVAHNAIRDLTGDNR